MKNRTAPRATSQPENPSPHKPLKVSAPWEKNLTANHRYGKNRAGRTFLRKSVKVWMEGLKYDIRNARTENGILDEYAPDQRFKISIDYYLLRRGGDADNYNKTIWDAIKMGLDVDDRHFVPGESNVIRVKHRHEQRFDITITQL